jgi:rod shape-determining protein MreB
MFGIRKIGIDLGTANTLIYLPKKGVIINEPTVVAVSTSDNSILAVGNEAKIMLGRTPDSIIASRPLKDGVIADYRIAQAMIHYYINKVGGSVRFVRPEVMIAVPAGITSTERRAVVEATLQAGAKSAYILKEPIAAAIGAGIPITTASGHMIVDIGGGTTEAAIISLGGIVVSNSVRVGGDKFDNAISEMIRKKHGLAIGERTAEDIKIKIANALTHSSSEIQEKEIRGRDLVTGLPKNITINSLEVTGSIQEQLKEIIRGLKDMLQDTPPELAADTMDKGIILSGGGALLKNIDKLIAESLGVPCYIADDPLLCVARGTGIALENLDSYKRSILSTK